MCIQDNEEEYEKKTVKSCNTWIIVLLVILAIFIIVGVIAGCKYSHQHSSRAASAAALAGSGRQGFQGGCGMSGSGRDASHASLVNKLTSGARRGRGADSRAPPMQFLEY